MTIEARCKLISLQFVVCPLTLYVRLMIIFVPYGTKEVKKDGEMSRTAHDCHTHFIYQLFSALICTGGVWIECVCTLVLKSKIMRMKQSCRVFSSIMLVSVFVCSNRRRLRPTFHFYFLL